MSGELMAAVLMVIFIGLGALLGLFFLGVLIFVIIDMLVDFKLSRWVSGNWKLTPAGHIRAHRARKIERAKEALRDQRRRDAIETRRYYHDRHMARVESRTDWQIQFNELRQPLMQSQRVVNLHDPVTSIERKKSLDELQLDLSIQAMQQYTSEMIWMVPYYTGKGRKW